MADYKTKPIGIRASATGGADVDVSATIFIDDVTKQEGDVTLVDVHQSPKRNSIRAHKISGQGVLRLIYVVAPLAGNGEFKVKVELTHPSFPNGKVVLLRNGDVSGGAPKTFRQSFLLP